MRRRAAGSGSSTVVGEPGIACLDGHQHARSLAALTRRARSRDHRTHVRPAPASDLQGSLFGFDEPAVDDTFAGLRRTHLDDHIVARPRCRAGCTASRRVFDQLWHELTWRQRTVTMWERRLPEPRLTSWWTPAEGDEPLPVLAEMRRVLSARYGEPFDSIGFNCYRDGNDSVAWHGDRHRHTVDDPVVAIVSVGARPAVPSAARVVAAGRGRSTSVAATCS